MIKLYICYFILGAYLLLESFCMWTFRSFNDSDGVLAFSALLFSFVLFAVAPGLALHRSRRAAIIGTIALIGYFPFGIRWLVYRYENEWPLTEGSFNQIMLAATLLYFVSLIYSIRYFIVFKVPPKINIKRSVKISLMILPIFLLGVFTIWILLNP